MILIVSDDNDKSTYQVIDWLVYYGEDFYRVSETNPIPNEFVKIEKKTKFFTKN